MIHNLPRADEMVAHARQKLVQRLDNAEATAPDKLKAVVQALEAAVYPQVTRNPLAGTCFIFLDPGQADADDATIAANVDLVLPLSCCNLAQHNSEIEYVALHNSEIEKC